MLQDIHGAADRAQTCSAALWDTGRQAGPEGAGGSGTAGRTDGHMPGREKSLGDVTLGRAPHMRCSAARGQASCRLEQSGGGQAGPTFVRDTTVVGELKLCLLGAVSGDLQCWPGQPRHFGMLGSSLPSIWPVGSLKTGEPCLCLLLQVRVAGRGWATGLCEKRRHRVLGHSVPAGSRDLCSSCF